MPTINQKTVFDKVVKKIRKGEKVSISQAMKESGVYSDAMLAHPEKITRSKGWNELLEEYLPDSLLASKHKEFLTSKKVVKTFRRGAETVETTETDPSAVRALDMGYKLKGRYNDITIDKAMIINVSPEIANKFNIKSLNEPNSEPRRDS